MTGLAGTKTSPKVLIIGVRGLIGSHLSHHFEGAGYEVYGTVHQGPIQAEREYMLDLENPNYEELPREVDLVVFCAGMTSIVDCEEQPSKARTINATNTIAVLNHYLNLGSFALFLSSSAVFDGSSPFPAHDHPVSPTSIYGLLKVEVENFLIQPNRRAAVLRLTKVISSEANPILDWTASLNCGDRIKVFANVTISPLTINTVCETVMSISQGQTPGLFQLGGDREITWENLARAHFADNQAALELIEPIEETSNLNPPRQSLSTYLPPREPQYQPLMEVDRFQMGLMSGFAYMEDPKRLTFTLSRYKFVAKMLRGCSSVLEVGCADAFGSPIVLQEVGSLTAVDFDEGFIADAKRTHPYRNQIKFFQHDLLEAPVSGTFDAVFALDVLEHIEKENEELFLQNITQSIGDEGVCIVGMPSLESQKYASEISKLGHVNCKTAEELKETMMTYFQNVFIFSMNDEVVHTGFSPMSQYLLALCCAKRTGGKKFE